MANKSLLALATMGLAIGLQVKRELRQSRSEQRQIEKHEMAKERHDRVKKK